MMGSRQQTHLLSAFVKSIFAFAQAPDFMWFDAFVPVWCAKAIDASESAEYAQTEETDTDEAEGDDEEEVGAR